jgi:hypothetical protein
MAHMKYVRSISPSGMCLLRLYQWKKCLTISPQLTLFATGEQHNLQVITQVKKN